MKKAVIYARVSTQDQAENGTSIETQLEKLRVYASLHNFKITNEYIDAGVSGAKFDRPALNQLKENIKDIDIVLIYKLDRLSRSMRDTMILIEDLFKKNDVALISLSENFDTTNAIGMATVGMLSTFAQLERETIKERMYNGKIQSVLNGNYINQPPFGYIKQNRKLVKDPKNEKLVNYIFERLLAGDSISQLGYNLRYMEIAKHLNHKWNPNTIAKIIHNDTYTGDTVLLNQRIQNTHEPYISKDDILKIRKLVSDRNYRKSTSKCNSFTALFRGLICCPNCTHMLSTGRRLTKHSGYTIYYRCANCRRDRKLAPAMMESLIEKDFFNKVVFKGFKVVSEKQEKKTIDFDKEFKKLKQKEDKIKQAWFDELINDLDFKNFQTEINSVRNDLKKKQEKVLQLNNYTKNVNNIKKLIVDLKNDYHLLTYDEKRELFVEIIDYINVDIIIKGRSVIPVIKNIKFKV